MHQDLISCSIFDSNELLNSKEAGKKEKVLCKSKCVRNKSGDEPKSENESADTGYFGSATGNTQSIEICLETDNTLYIKSREHSFESYKKRNSCIEEETNVVHANIKSISKVQGNNELKAQPKELDAIISETPSEDGTNEDYETNKKAVSNTVSASKPSKVERSQSCQTLTSHYLKQAKTRKISLLMFSITLVSVLSFVPHLTLVLVRNIYTDFVINLSDTERAVYNFFYKSFFLNCAVNPIIYNFFDSRFRQSVKGIFIRNCKKNAIVPDYN
jgi:hypothetical protein